MANRVVYFARFYNISLPDHFPICDYGISVSRFENTLGGDVIMGARWGIDTRFLREHMQKHGSKDSIIWLIIGGEDPDRMSSITLNGRDEERDVKYGFDAIRIDIKKGDEKTMLSYYPQATILANNRVKLYIKGTYNFLTDSSILYQRKDKPKIKMQYSSAFDFTPKQEIVDFFKEVPYISEKISFLWKGQDALGLYPVKHYEIDNLYEGEERIEVYKKWVNKYNGIESCSISSNHWHNCVDEEYIRTLNKTKIQFRELALNN